MKKSAKFMAVVLAVVLALSCFTVAFADDPAQSPDPEKNIFQKIGDFFKSLLPGDLPKPEVPSLDELREGLSNMKVALKTKASENYQAFVEEHINEGALVIEPIELPEFIVVPEGIKGLFDNDVVNGMKTAFASGMGKMITSIGTFFDLAGEAESSEGEGQPPVESGDTTPGENAA